MAQRRGVLLFRSHIWLSVPKSEPHQLSENRPGAVQNGPFLVPSDPHCGAVWQAVSHRFIPHKNRTSALPLAVPDPRPETAAHRGPTPRFRGGRCTGATTRSGAPQTPSKGPTRGRTAGGPLHWRGTAFCIALSAGHITGPLGGTMSEASCSTSLSCRHSAKIHRRSSQSTWLGSVACHAAKHTSLIVYVCPPVSP